MGPAGHTLAGLTVYYGACICSGRTPTVTGSAAAALLAVSPDFDLLTAVWVGFPAANRYHHSYTHTFAFAMAAGMGTLVIHRLVRGAFRWQAGVLGFLIVSGHLLTDFFTRDTGYPYGQMLFWPLSDRYLLGPVVFLDIAKPSWSGLLDMHNLKATIHELLLFTPVVSWMAFHLHVKTRTKMLESAG
ncbi:metal-dependent hydrolase [bacterium]|nr:metal-dependent hydrolase [candidate division CSSED10-310 bacterium]